MASLSSFFGTKASKKEKATSKLVEAGITKAQKAQVHLLTLLLLGTGESGKTTVFKQIRMSKGEGYQSDYYEEMKNKLCTNVIEPMVNILEAMATNEAFRVQGDTTFEESAKVILDNKAKFVRNPLALVGDQVLEGDQLKPTQLSDHFDQPLFDALKYAYEKEEFQAALAKYNADGSFNVPDSFPTLMSKLLKNFPKWGGLGWKPNDEDVLLVRIRTTGFNDQKFDYEGVQLRMIDVGGQRAERKKWIHMFDGVNAVLFVVATSEYDQTLYEDGKTNRMQESIRVFGETCDNKHFTDSAIVLFLNKIDLFDIKFRQKKIPLNASGLFPDAPTAVSKLQSKASFLLFLSDGIYLTKRNDFVE